MSSTNPLKLDSALGKFLPSMGKSAADPASPTAASNVTKSSAAASLFGSSKKPSSASFNEAPKEKKEKMSIGDLNIMATLGTGSFGRVHLVRNKNDNKFAALKVLRKQEVIKLRQVEHTINEKNILELLDNPFLVRLHGTFQDSNCLFLVLEYIQGGELFSYLRKSGVCFTLTI